MEASLISTGIRLIAVIFMVMAKGFFVATEFALISARRTSIKQPIDKGNRIFLRLLGFSLTILLAACATPGGVPAPVTVAPSPPPSNQNAAATQIAPTGGGNAGGTPAAKATVVQPKELPFKGRADAPVTNIEFADYQ